MSPSLVSPIEWLTGGVDSARASADQRLGVVLDQLAGLGVAASGTRGDDSVLRRSTMHFASSTPIT